MAAPAALMAVLAQGGRFSAALDVLTHFAPFYVVAGVLAVLVGLVLRALGAAGLGVVAILAGGALMAPEYLRPPPPATAPAQGQIKLIQFNAYKRNIDIVRVADWLIAQNPDIVTLQEARHDLRDLLLKRTQWDVAGRKEHVMIFSREPRLRMVRPVRGGGMTYMNATYPSATGPFEVVTTHLDWPTGAAFARQHTGLARVTAGLPRDRMILTGDFNTTPWSFAMRRTDKALGLIRLDRAIWSFPARGAMFAVLPIDHVYAGPGWRVVSIERGPDLGSDHYPLIVTLAPASPR